MEHFSIERLRRDLQRALELEFTTVPAYLTALYSIKEGTNAETVRQIRGVVMEEMYHMTLVGNVLNAVGGRPVLDGTTVPRYPAVPFPATPGFEVHLRPLSRPAVEGFMRIEEPTPADAAPDDESYSTIGQLYAAIEVGLQALKTDLGTERLLPGEPSHQVTSQQYYGGGGEVLEIHDIQSAEMALGIIVDQGEGLKDEILDGDARYFQEAEELAHYFRFKEILAGRHYKIGTDAPTDAPSGAPLPVDWDAVWPMQVNPDPAEYGAELREMDHKFNSVYSNLVDLLHRAFNGSPTALVDGVMTMYKLKYRAQALMKLRWKNGTAGPSFLYVPKADRTE